MDNGASTKPKVEMDHSREGRLKRAKGRNKGMFLVLLAQEELATAAGDDASAFVIVANENECLQDDADCAAWMEENGYVGVLHPVRFLKGKDKEQTTRRYYKRYEQRTFGMERG